MPCISGIVITLAPEDVAQVTSTGWACNFYTTTIRIRLRHATHPLIGRFWVSLSLLFKANSQNSLLVTKYVNQLLLDRNSNPCNISYYTSKAMQRLKGKGRSNSNDKDTHMYIQFHWWHQGSPQRMRAIHSPSQTLWSTCKELFHSLHIHTLHRLWSCCTHQYHGPCAKCSKRWVTLQGKLPPTKSTKSVAITKNSV